LRDLHLCGIIVIKTIMVTLGGAAVIEISVSKAKASLSEYLNRAAYGGERVVILSRGKPKAAIISTDDLTLLEEWEEQQEAEMLAEAIESTPRFHSVAEVEAEIGLGESASAPETGADA
jgi:prevent-host-death family protein